MQPFVRHTGLVVPLDRADVDTDQIIPKQFLKRIERTGFGEYLFYDWRFTDDGRPNPAFELNESRYAGATILLAGRNFGCGSSREHAVWALRDFGIQVVVAISFADIFYANCLSNGLLPVPLGASDIALLMRRCREQEGYALTVDLEGELIADSGGWSAAITIDAFHRYRLLNGLDDIALTLQHEAAIAAFEQHVTAATST